MQQEIRWKNGARCVVMLSFDVDGESLWIARPIEIAGYWLDQGYSGGKPLDTT